jgi:hypothetical protein
MPAFQFIFEDVHNKAVIRELLFMFLKFLLQF